MAFIVGKDCFDSISSDVNCTYPPTALGGTEYVCDKGKGNIRYGNPQNPNAPLVTFHVGLPSPEPTFINPVPGIKTISFLGVCLPGTRVILSTKNSNVFFNNQLPAVTGDKVKLLSTQRPLVGPFKYATGIGGPRIFIGTGGPG